jgi:glucose/mannose-6-phosphate isomerase
MAGQFLNRWVTLFGSGFMQSVADRWKSQINENAKAWAQVENISDTCHSTLGGIINPESQLTQMMTLFLISPNDKPQDQARLDAARRIFLVEGFNTDFYRAKGSTLLENMWSAIQFGDFISYYLAIAYKVDPTPVPGVAEINSILN